MLPVENCKQWFQTQINSEIYIFFVFQRVSHHCKIQNTEISQPKVPEIILSIVTLQNGTKKMWKSVSYWYGRKDQVQLESNWEKKKKRERFTH